MSSSVSHGYVRTRLADGSFQPETYVFKKGGFLSGQLADSSLDSITFEEMTAALVPPLARSNYFPASDPRNAKLVIVVYWGATWGLEYSGLSIAAQQTGATDPHPQIASGRPPRDFDSMADEQNRYTPQLRVEAYSAQRLLEENARTLGYQSPWDPDLRDARYFVVLLAYDSQALTLRKKNRLLWQTRFSVNEHTNQFNRQLAAMASGASFCFGQDSSGLRHTPVPEGNVHIGDLKSLEVVSPTDYVALSPDGTHVAYFSAVKSTFKLVIADIDRPERTISSRVPGLELPPRAVSWADRGHVVVTLASTEAVSFDTSGRRSKAASVNTEFLSPRKTDGSVQDLANDKLPHRKVTVLSSDTSGQRVLLLATGGSGSARYFVLDRPSDLLFEIGRSGQIP